MRRTALDMVYELAKEDDRVVFIGSDLGAGTLDNLREEMPDRFFMEGINEANVIGMAAGMAMDGMVPFVNTIATFLTRRCYEQVAVDLCLHNLPVKLIANGGGMVYAPLGPTHIALEDMAIMRALPNMSVFAPSDKEEMRKLIPATMEVRGPSYVRLAKGGDEVISNDKDGFEIGRAIEYRDIGDVVFITTGILTNRAMAAADELKADGIDAGVMHLHTIKPLDDAAIMKAARGASLLVVAEEHSRIGGLGSAVTDLLAGTYGAGGPRILTLGVPDVFTNKYGSQDDLLEIYGLQPAQLAQSVREAVSASRPMTAISG
jgi:transketolase